MDTSQGKKTCASFDCEGAKKVSTLIGCYCDCNRLLLRGGQEGEHVNRLKVFRGLFTMAGALSKKCEHVNRLSKKVSCCGRALWCRPLCLSSLSLSLFLSPYTLVHSITLSLSHTHTHFLSNSHPHTSCRCLSSCFSSFLPLFHPSSFLP